MKKELISVINKHFSEECLEAMYAIYKDHILRNDEKRKKYNETLDKFGVKYIELGPGTNRYGIKIDGVVIKIAYDIDGFRNNRIEFAASQDLYPYCAKTYECNGLMVAQEYVTKMSKPDFKRFESKIKEALKEITSKYIVGDVGYIYKNYINWGYRDNDSVCMLDYGETYHVLPDELLCDNITNTNKRCNTLLTYTTDYSMLVCPKCGYKFSHLDIRDRMEQHEEDERVEEKIQKQYKFDREKSITIDAPDVSVVDEVIDDIVDPDEEFFTRLANGDTTMHFLFSDDEEDEFEECALTERMHLVSVFGIPMLFTEKLVSDDDMLPEMFDTIRIRHRDDDEREMGYIGKNILVGFVGSFISTHPFNIRSEVLEILDDDISEKPGTINLREYASRMANGKFSEPFTIDDDYIYKWRNGLLEEDEEVVEEEEVPNVPNVASDMDDDFDDSEEFTYKTTYFASEEGEDDDEDGPSSFLSFTLPDSDEEADEEEEEEIVDAIFNGTEEEVEEELRHKAEEKARAEQEREERINEATRIAMGIKDNVPEEDNDDDDESTSEFIEEYVEEEIVDEGIVDDDKFKLVNEFIMPEKFKLVKIFDVPMLMTDERIPMDFNIPFDLCNYHIRANEDGKMTNICYSAITNFAASILSIVPIDEELVDNGVEFDEYVDLEETDTEMMIHEYVAYCTRGNVVSTNILDAEYINEVNGEDDDEEFEPDPDDTDLAAFLESGDEDEDEYEEEDDNDMTSSAVEELRASLMDDEYDDDDDVRYNGKYRK